MRPIDPADSAVDDLPSNDAARDLGELLTRYRPRLRRLVEARLDRRIRRRLDPSDVLQDAFLEITRRLPQYSSEEVSFYTWVRFLTVQKVSELHRRHLGRQNRDARREVRWMGSGSALTTHAQDRGPTPSAMCLSNERREAIYAALEELPAIDREVVLLRHFESYGNVDVAALLGISAPAACLRYVRALKRLGERLRVRERARSTPRAADGSHREEPRA